MTISCCLEIKNSYLFSPFHVPCCWARASQFKQDQAIVHNAGQVQVGRLNVIFYQLMSSWKDKVTNFMLRISGTEQNLILL